MDDNVVDKMRNILTLSDSKYGAQGIALYNSLRAVNTDFVLHYLCLDKKMYKAIKNLDGCTAYQLDDIIISGEEIEQHRRTHTWEKHCWTLASYFLTCLRGFGVGSGGDTSLLYVDADMYFYQDFEKIYDDIGRRSVGIISHRFNHDRETKTGKYNVGIIYFKDDKRGNACLKWWSDVVINDNNEWF